VRDELQLETGRSGGPFPKESKGTERWKEHRAIVSPRDEQPCQAWTSTEFALSSRFASKARPDLTDPSCRAGAEPGKPTDSAEGPGERTADTRRISQVDDIPSITLIRSESIILITLTLKLEPPIHYAPSQFWGRTTVFTINKQIEQSPILKFHNCIDCGIRAFLECIIGKKEETVAY
jgi:hypothetical protein